MENQFNLSAVYNNSTHDTHSGLKYIAMSRACVCVTDYISIVIKYDYELPRFIF